MPLPVTCEPPDDPKPPGDRVARDLSAIGEFVARVAHDLNNPLTSIAGYAQLLLGRDHDPGVRRGLEVIAGEAQRAVHLVQDLLTVAGKRQTQRRRLGLNGLVRKTLELKADDLRRGRVQTVADLEPDLPMTLLDFHQVQQVILNLLFNAMQAIHEKRPEGTIRLITRRGERGIVLAVEDDGPGIPEEILPRIFDPFFTTKPPSIGTGLGLPICQGIVTEHGGAMWAENRPGGGARFVVELPIIEAPDETQACRDDAARGNGGEPAAGTGAAATAAGVRSVLVVDDEGSIQDVLVAMLTLDGHRIDTAGSGETALEKIAARRYDTILCDLRMKGMSGIELYERLVSRDRDQAERVVFMTGDLITPETGDFLKRVPNLSLSKPFTLESLREILRRSVREGS